jgi:hypothetical protein
LVIVAALLYPLPATPPSAGTRLSLFDGASLANWRMAGLCTIPVLA